MQIADQAPLLLIPITQTVPVTSSSAISNPDESSQVGTQGLAGDASSNPLSSGQGDSGPQQTSAPLITPNIGGPTATMPSLDPQIYDQTLLHRDSAVTYLVTNGNVAADRETLNEDSKAANVPIQIVPTFPAGTPAIPTLSQPFVINGLIAVPGNTFPVVVPPSTVDSSTGDITSPVTNATSLFLPLQDANDSQAGVLAPAQSLVRIPENDNPLVNLSSIIAMQQIPGDSIQNTTADGLNPPVAVQKTFLILTAPAGGLPASNRSMSVPSGPTAPSNDQTPRHRALSVAPVASTGEAASTPLQNYISKSRYGSTAVAPSRLPSLGPPIPVIVSGGSGAQSEQSRSFSAIQNPVPPQLSQRNDGQLTRQQSVTFTNPVVQKQEPSRSGAPSISDRTLAPSFKTFGTNDEGARKLGNQAGGSLGLGDPSRASEPMEEPAALSDLELMIEADEARAVDKLRNAVYSQPVLKLMFGSQVGPAVKVMLQQLAGQNGSI